MTTNTETRVQETRERRVAKPYARFVEDDEGYTILAEIPGADESSTEVKVEDDVLTIHAKSLVEPIPAELELAYSDLELCDWKCSFRLGDRIDREAIGASIKNGVLSLRLPKAQPTRRTITVSAAK